MSVLLTNHFSFLQAKLFKDSFADTSENKYVFLAKIDSYGDDDDNPDELTLIPTNRRDEEITLHNDIIALKKALPADVSFVTKFHEWTSGVIYNQYSDTVDLTTYRDTDSGTDDDNPYFVVTGADTSGTSTPGIKYVYKCLDNNSNGASTVHPTTSTAGTQPSRLPADKYVWKYMYSIIQTDWDNWVGTTGDWIPIQTLTSADSTHQWDIQSNAVSGSVNHITGIDHATLTISNNGNQVTLTGDGTGFTATVVWNSTTDRYFNITNAGSGYTNVTAVNIAGTANVNLSAVIAPRGGHGWDAVTELSGHYVMVLVEFVNDEEPNGYIYIDNDYRKVGIISIPNVKTTSLGVAGSSDTIDTNALVLGERADAMVKDQRIALKYATITGITATELAHERARDVTVTQTGTPPTISTGKIVHVDITVGTQLIYIIPDYSTTVFDHTIDLTATILDSNSAPQSVTITLDGATLVDYDIIRDTGNIIYIDNLDALVGEPYYPVRRDDQTDKIDLVIEF